MRYTAGYIVRKLEKKFSHQTTQEAKECTEVLKEMASKLKARNRSVLGAKSMPSSCEWTCLVDRGGLHFEDIVYSLFVEIELIADEKLSEIFKDKGKGLEKVRKENLVWICDNDDVQFLWSMVSPAAIEDESV